MAPEVLNRNYREKCDLWSAGVLLYSMVCGTMPFQAPNNLLLSEIIRKGELYLPDNITSECASLLTGLLQKNPEKRLSAAEALDHPWFVPALSPSPAISLDFTRLARYSKLDKFQRLIIAYMAVHTADSELMKERNMFMKINKSKTGVLSRDEIEKWIAERNKVTIPKSIFEEIDLNRNNEIDYFGTFS